MAGEIGDIFRRRMTEGDVNLPFCGWSELGCAGDTPSCHCLAFLMTCSATDSSCSPWTYVCWLLRLLPRFPCRLLRLLHLLLPIRSAAAWPAPAPVQAEGAAALLRRWGMGLVIIGTVLLVLCCCCGGRKSDYEELPGAEADVEGGKAEKKDSGREGKESKRSRSSRSKSSRSRSKDSKEKSSRSKEKKSKSSKKSAR